MRLMLAMPGNEALATKICAAKGCALGALDVRRFPDQESYVRIANDVTGADVDILCTLRAPDAQFLPLIFTAETARELGAKSVRLIAPYLAYLRQDARFREGEAVSSRHFARLLSQSFDSLTTIDPHLHRYPSLDAIYTIPAQAIGAASLIGDWIKTNVESPLVIGPDIESQQWAGEIARQAQAPFTVAAKQRLGDRRVQVSMPDLSQWRARTPVLIDDIAASGRTLLEATRQLRGLGFGKPVCIVVHAIFADQSYQQLLDAAQSVLTTDTIPHPSNALSVAALIAASQGER